MRLQIGIEIVRRRHGVEDEIEPAGVVRHGVGVSGDADLVRAQTLAIGDLAGRGSEQDDVGTHGMGDLHPHVTQATQADDTDLLPRTGTPVAQGRVGRDTGTEQGRDTGQILLGMPDAQDKGLLDDDRLRIAAIGVLAAEERTVVGTGKTVVAILLLAIVT